MKLTLQSLLMILSAFLFSTSVKAASDQFHTYYDISYKFLPTGASQVQQKITLTNLFSQVYATSYTLKLKGEQPKNITGFDSQGPLKITTHSLGSDTTEINVTFNESAAGKGQSTSFTLNYEGPNAVKNGQIWDITLPKLANSDFADDYQLNLFIPSNFGQPAYISPFPQNSSTSSGYTHYVFAKNQVSTQGVVASFGDFQTFDFRLEYHLANTTSQAQKTTIALPPDTPYQKLFYTKLDPTPETVEIDADGNWLAKYTLQSKSATNISAQGQAHIFSFPTSSHYTSTSLPNTYLKSAKYWPVADPQIISLSRQYSTPQDIYNYVVKTLKYDYSRISSSPHRYGATLALEHPTQSLCTEYTDLFITLSRSAGIPAREINGYALSTDPKIRPLSLVSDVLHAWPEYWDEKGLVWKSIDPTWESTTGGVDYFNKLDLAHFAFVIHGSDSLTPKAAGLYKISPDSKDVDVKVGEYQDHPTQPLVINWKKPLQLLPLVSNKSVVEIYNPGPTALYNLPVNISGQILTLDELSTSKITALPPYSRTYITVSFSKSLFPDFKPGKYLGFSVGTQQVTYNVPDTLYLTWYVLIVVTTTLTIFAIAKIAHFAWHLYLQKFPR